MEIQLESGHCGEKSKSRYKVEKGRELWQRKLRRTKDYEDSVIEEELTRWEDERDQQRDQVELGLRKAHQQFGKANMSVF